MSANQWYAVPSGVPPGPTVSIQETDTGGMVFEGDAATFVISIDHAVDHNVMVDYTTVDGTGASGATAVSDYASTHGPREAVIVAGDTEATIYDSEFAALQVSTTGGIDGGGDKQFLVKLSNPNECQLGANSSATATIVRPEVDITSPDESSGTIDVSAGIGGRTEVDLQAKVNPAYAASGDTGFQLTVPDGAENLTFWTAQTGGTQLSPDANDVLETIGDAEFWNIQRLGLGRGRRPCDRTWPLLHDPCPGGAAGRDGTGGPSRGASQDSAWPCRGRGNDGDARQPR